jgi:hypothetical protein
MIGFISTTVTFCILITINTALWLYYTLFSPPLYTLGFSVVTSRLLTTDLTTETSTSNDYEIFLLFRLQSLWNLGSKHSSGPTPPAYDWLVTAHSIHFSYKHSAQTPWKTPSLLLLTSLLTRKCVYRKPIYLFHTLISLCFSGSVQSLLMSISSVFFFVFVVYFRTLLQ